MDEKKKSKKGGFSGQLGFVMAAAGSAAEGWLRNRTRRTGGGQGALLDPHRARRFAAPGRPPCRSLRRGPSRRRAQPLRVRVLRVWPRGGE